MNRSYGPQQAGPAAPGGDPRGGRPLDRSRDVVIRAAVLQVLAEQGCRGLSIDAVARAAGVGKATIYRRWSSKEDLLVDVVEAMCVDSLVIPDTGTLRDDLVQLLRSLADVLTGPGGDANRALLGALPEQPALAEAYRRGPLSQWAGAFSAAFQRAARRGQSPPGAGRSLAAEAGPAILIERWLLGDPRMDDDAITAVVTELMMPSLAQEGPAEPSTT